jgi:electron transport complex protein RnfA
MSNVFAILLGTVLANNLVFAHLLGLEPLLAAPRRSLRDLIEVGSITALSLTLSAGLAWAIERGVLQPNALGFLRAPALILVATASIGLVGAALGRTNAALRDLWQRQRGLVAVNSAVLGVALLATRDLASLGAALLFGASAGMAFTLVALLFAALRERLIDSEIPAPFRGAPIELLTASLMALAFAGLAGLERHA